MFSVAQFQKEANLLSPLRRYVEVNVRGLTHPAAIYFSSCYQYASSRVTCFSDTFLQLALLCIHCDSVNILHQVAYEEKLQHHGVITLDRSSNAFETRATSIFAAVTFLSHTNASYTDGRVVAPYPANEMSISCPCEGKQYS